MTNREKFLALVSKEETNTIERAKVRIERRAYARISKKIALSILIRLYELNWKQKDLAEEMDVSPQLVNKWVKGNENFTLETLTRLGKVLGIELIQVPNRMEVKVSAEVKLPTATIEYKIPEQVKRITPVVKMKAVV